MNLLDSESASFVSSLGKVKEIDYFLRALAGILDVWNCFAILYLIAFILDILNYYDVNHLIGFQANVLLIFTCFLYFFIFEALCGQTLGKMVFGLKVFSDPQKPCGWKASWIRNFIRPLEIAPLGIPALLSMVTSPTQQRLGDRAARTVVQRCWSKMRFLLALGFSIALTRGLYFAIDYWVRHFLDHWRPGC